MRIVTGEEAVSYIRSGDRVYVHGGAATPHVLISAMMARRDELHEVEVVHLHSMGPAPYVEPGMQGHFRHNALFIGPNVRPAVRTGLVDYTPVFLSEIPALFQAGGPLPLDVAFIHVTPSDDAGNCSLGVSVDVALAAARNAKLVIAQVNPLMPRTSSPPVAAAEIDLGVETGVPLPEHKQAPVMPEHEEIGRHVAQLVENGSTLQLGIGSVPDAVLRQLQWHKDLGIHTEMFTDGLLPLITAGVVNGARKSIHPRKIVTAFVIGSQALYSFVDRNRDIEFLPVDYTNSVEVIAQNERMVAINSALSVDLTGQVVADSIGSQFYSGIGGQVDFIRGAARSRGGVPVIALPSTACGGTVSRIVAELAQGAGVTTTRGDVHWVVTEFGVANLHGRSIRERARLLMDLAHPKFRSGLEEEAGNLGYLSR